MTVCTIEQSPPAFIHTYKSVVGAFPPLLAEVGVEVVVLRVGVLLYPRDGRVFQSTQDLQPVQHAVIVGVMHPATV